MAREYAAFISYRHKPLDIAVATRLHKSIERFQIPGDLRREEKKNPGTVFTNWGGTVPERMLVFRDREELPLSNDLTSDIFDALDNAKCLIVVCTPDTPKSLWVRREISHFIEKHGRKRIITVLAAGTPEESIPKEITARYADDGVTVLEEYEPLVAYLVADSQREVIKKLDQERLRVLAAILGCPYDSLKQRHKRRRMQQALAVAAAAFLVALSFIGILVNRNLEIQAQKLEVENQKQEVERQKQEAEAQRRMVQLRESELLAADARAALETGNSRLAIEYAVSALPKAGEEDRPYYAPAESVLMEAMDVTGGSKEHEILSDVVLEQMTPVYNLAVSADGATIVTIDKYGVLHGYDVASGGELWSDIITTDEIYKTISYIRISGDSNYLVSLYGETLEGRSLRDGQLLWRYDMDLAADGYFIYDDDRNRVAVLKAYSSAEENASILELEVLSAQTGIAEQTIRLETLEDIPYQTIHNSYQSRLSDGGVFSKDGRYFACAFSREHEEKEKSRLMCFVADLQEGKLVRTYEKEISYSNFDLSGMRFYEDGLAMALEPNDNDVAGVLLKLDWMTGRLLWQTTTPAELGEILLIGDRRAYTIFAESVVILGKYDKLYTLDPDTGELRSTTEFPGTLSAMYLAGDSYVAFALQDGTYGIGLYKKQGGFALTTDSFYNIWTSVGEHNLMQIYGGGIVQFYTDGNYIELSVSNVDRPGYAVVVPKENPNQLIIKRPVTLEKTVASTAITAPVDGKRLTCRDVDCMELEDNLLLVGQLSYDDEEYNSHYFYLIMDKVTHEVKDVLPVEDVYSTQYFFLRSGKEYIEHQIRAKDSSSVYLRDGTILTVKSDGQQLSILKDGVKEETVPLPETHLIDPDFSFSVQRYVQAGRNGYLVTHLANVIDPLAATDVAFYDTANRTWFQPQLAAPLTNTNSYAFAENAPLFAAVDGENQIQVWNLQSHEEVARFPLQLPDNSVLHMDFLVDDSYLMVKTQDAKALVYEITTGQIMLQDQLDTANDGKLTAQIDPASQRLYIIDTNVYGTNMLCVDLRSWTVLARGEKILCYIPQTNELYYVDGSYGSTKPEFFCFQVPDTATLVQMGQQILETDGV